LKHPSPAHVHHAVNAAQLILRCLALQDRAARNADARLPGRPQEAAGRCGALEFHNNAVATSLVTSRDSAGALDRARPRRAFVLLIAEAGAGGCCRLSGLCGDVDQRVACASALLSDVQQRRAIFFIWTRSDKQHAPAAAAAPPLQENWSNCRFPGFSGSFSASGRSVAGCSICAVPAASVVFYMVATQHLLRASCPKNRPACACRCCK